MENDRKSLAGMQDALLDAMLPHVVFDGWTRAALMAAADEAGIPASKVAVLAPRGAADMAVAYHKRGDAQMVRALGAEDLGTLRFRERVTRAVRLRLQSADREVVRRGAALFALPQHGVTGARLVWGTADAIWRALGDTSDDINWYTKRATLSAVYASTALYWLGDETPGAAATWEFLDRRIENVMQFETAKGKLRDNPTLGRILAGPMQILGRIRAPDRITDGLPGRWRGGK